MVGIGLGLFARRGPLDRVVADWVANVMAVGDNPSPSTVGAMNAFVSGCRTDGTWTKLMRVNLFCGSSLAGCLTPLKRGGGGATDTNFNFVAGDYSEASGLTGNGSTKYLATGFVPSLATGGFGVYLRSTEPTTSRCLIGTQDSGGTQCYRLIKSGNNLLGGWGGNGSASITLTPTPSGLWAVSRTASASLGMYRSGSSVATFATSTTPSATAGEVTVFGLNNAGVPGSLTSATLGAYWIDSGLSASDQALVFARMQAFQTALARQVAP